MRLLHNKIDIEKYSIRVIKDFIQTTIDEIIKTGLNDKGLTPEEFAKRENKRKRLQESLKECMYGSPQAKQFVKDFITDLLIKTYNLTEENINYIINFENPKSLSIQDKFDILLYIYKLQYYKMGLSHLIKKYKMDELKNINDMTYYCITEEEIEEAFKMESPTLTLEDKIEIIVQRIYSLYKGYNCIDEILDMQIDGISGGVNGLPEDFISNQIKWSDNYFKEINEVKIPRSCDSIWIFFEGKPIHLRFLSFGSYEELQRICQNIYKFGSPGQLSKSSGYIINKLKDGSRVVVMRPDFCESWAFFVRKFEVSNLSLETLIKGKNAEKVINLLKLLVKGSRNIAITGSQGSGKTTMLLALIEHIYSVYTLRILEMAFELHVRKIFPYKNVVTIQETENISGQEGLDVLKKSDGTVTIVGEVATDPVAAYMIQTAQVASKFALFTHHAKTFKELVMALRNSLLKTGVFNNEQIAEEQIIRVLHFDIHLEKDFYGNRYIERITECIPIEEDYPTHFRNAKTIEEKLEAFMETTLVFYKKITGRKLYEYRNIVEFDPEKKEYVFKNKISAQNLKEIFRELTNEDREFYKEFLD